MTAIRHAVAGTVLRLVAIGLVKLCSVRDRPPRSQVQYIQEATR